MWLLNVRIRILYLLFSERLDLDQYVMKTDPQPQLNVFPASALNYGRGSISFPHHSTDSTLTI
jgi:hypothetical protein